MKLPTTILGLSLVIGIVLFSLWAVFSQGTLQFTVTFDGNSPIAPGEDIGIAQYAEHGMWFRAIGPVPSRPPYHLGRDSGGRAGFPDNGTAYLYAALGDFLTISDQNGSAFGLESADIAEFSTFYVEPKTVPFIRY